MKTQIIAVCGVAMLAMAGFPHFTAAKTKKECTAEWNANKATLQAGGKTRAKFITECRATNAAAEAGKAAPTKAEPAATPAATSAVATGKDQYAKEADAKAHCGANPVVWVNLRSKVYHASGTKSYGTTKKGAYMCEKEAGAAGFRAPKSRKKS